MIRDDGKGPVSVQLDTNHIVAVSVQVRSHFYKVVINSFHFTANHVNIFQRAKGQTEFDCIETNFCCKAGRSVSLFKALRWSGSGKVDSLRHCNPIRFPTHTLMRTMEAWPSTPREYPSYLRQPPRSAWLDQSSPSPWLHQSSPPPYHHGSLSRP